MKEFQATTTINAAPETIWALLTDSASFPSWDPNVDSVDGTIAKGKKVTVHTTLSDRAFPVTVTVFDPPRAMTWSSGMPLGLFKGQRTFTLTPQEDGTTRYDVREQFTGPLLALIGRSIPDLTESFEQHAAGLKARAEAYALSSQ